VRFGLYACPKTNQQDVATLTDWWRKQDWSIINYKLGSRRFPKEPSANDYSLACHIS
jgi:hypothetical protein